MTDQLTPLDNTHLKNIVKNHQDIIIVDIRSSSEYQREHIPGSINIPIDQLNNCDTKNWQGKTLLFYCKSGIRTQQAKPLIDALPGTHKYCLSQGIEQWKACGLSTQKKPQAPLELVRQVQITAGVLILLGIGLAHWVSPYFIWLTAFVGAGFILAGATGSCGMARLLMLLPYNRR